MLEIGDLTCIYSKVLNLNLHEDIVKNLKKCLQQISALKLPFEDELVNSKDMKTIKNIIIETLDIIDEAKDVIKDKVKTVKEFYKYFDYVQ